MQGAFLVATTLFALLVGANAAEKNEYAPIHTLAVISTIGNVTVRNNGALPGGSDEFTLYANWDLDNQITQEVVTVLSSHFAISKTTIDPQAFSNLDTSALGTAWQDVQRRVKALPPTSGIDAYVVVFPHLIGGSMGVTWHGLSVDRNRSIWGGGHALVGAYYGIGVYNATTGERIDYATGQYPTSRTISGHMAPIDECPLTISAASESNMTSEQNVRLRREFASLFSRSIAYSLASANLISEAEANAATASFLSPGDAECKPF